MKTHVVLFLLFIGLLSFGQNGPQNLAKSDRGLWTIPFESESDFDVASKCEMLVFIEVFNQYDAYTETQIINLTKLKSINKISVENWKTATKKNLIENFNALNKSSYQQIIKISNKITWQELSAIEIKKQIPENLSKWYYNSKTFYENYIYEQIRLAALFPKITSEIATNNSNEITGNEFLQKHFLLTFDDGPTPENGNTDKTLQMLEKYNLPAIFFVLGDSFHNRKVGTSSQKIKKLYNNHSVASHGKEHKSHQKLDAWKNSLDYTSNEIESVFNKNVVDFRPPYGQRKKEIAQYLDKKNEKIILWNIDSQDWNNKINAQEIADRQITLMLLWRKGILLFHDIHPKAQTAVPIIYNYFKNCKINWVTSCENAL